MNLRQLPCDEFERYVFMNFAPGTLERRIYANAEAQSEDAEGEAYEKGYESRNDEIAGLEEQIAEQDEEIKELKREADRAYDAGYDSRNKEIEKLKRELDEQDRSAEEEIVELESHIDGLEQALRDGCHPDRL
jgi:chromosome segregation ATPase